jgi:hypothetical protein
MIPYRLDERRRINVEPTVVAVRFAHSASRRQRVTCALPGDPIRMRITFLGLLLRRSMMAGQFFVRATGSPILYGEAEN